MAFVVRSDAQQTKYSFECPLNSGGKISVHYCVFESSAEQDIEFTMCAAAHPSKVQHLLSFDETLEER